MALQQIKTFKNIQDAIIDRGKLQDTVAVRTQLKEKINEAQKALACEKPYGWSGMNRAFVLKGRYTTGTITATNGSHAITGSGTTWAELSHLNSKIKIGSQESPYTIKRVGSATTATIEPAFEGTTASSLSYTIYKDEYGLFPDLHELRQLRVPTLRRYVLPRGFDYVDERRTQQPFLGGYPKMYTTGGKGVYFSKTWANFLIGTDFWEDEVDADYPRNKNLIIYPAIFEDDRNCIIRYTRIPAPMGRDSEEPLLSIEWRRILVLKVLVENFLQHRDVATKREWEKEYKKLHKEMQSDVEPTDEDTVFQVNREKNKFHTRWSDDDEPRNW